MRTRELVTTLLVGAAGLALLSPLATPRVAPSGAAPPDPPPTAAPDLAPTAAPRSAIVPAADLVTARIAGPRIPDGPVPMAGCPPPPPERTGGGPGGPRWRPAVTVAESALPAPLPPPAWTSDPSPIAGKGMWLWQISKSEGGDIGRIVDRAAAAGLTHLWVRVGDSRYGFYAEEVLAELVPLAHAAGLDVIGWGFPFLHDPVADAGWTEQVLRWRGPDGTGLDGFSPDIERETENVELSAARVAVYLGLVRRAAGDLPIPATVYPPADWVVESGYPYETMAPYVDAFVPMAYWMCEEPGGYASRSIERLAHLRPVHVIGQAFANETHNRRVPPSRDETLRFLDVTRRGGALGASLWVWQDIGAEQWGALSDYRWPT